MRKGDFHAADVDDGFVETHHQAVCLVFEGLDERVQLHRRGETAPPLVHSAVRQRPEETYKEQRYDGHFKKIYLSSFPIGHTSPSFSIRLGVAPGLSSVTREGREWGVNET